MNMKSKISPADYASILKCIELDNISLSKCSMEVFNCSKKGGSINLNFKDKYTFSDAPNTVNFIASFKLEGVLGEDENKETLFKMSGEFNISYFKTSEVIISKDFFDVFKEMSLIVFVWPYYREYIQNMIVRAGIPPFTLPMRIFGHSK